MLSVKGKNKYGLCAKKIWEINGPAYRLNTKQPLKLGWHFQIEDSTTAGNIPDLYPFFEMVVRKYTHKRQPLRVYLC
jgi:hypothetical protein